MSESVCQGCGRTAPSDPETGYRDELCPQCEAKHEDGALPFDVLVTRLLGQADEGDAVAGQAAVELVSLRTKLRYRAKELSRAVNAHCTCGGGDRYSGCPACKVWHSMAALMGDE